MKNKTALKMRKFGLVGKDISYSFSKKYFTEKFKKENLEHTEYENYNLNSIEEFKNITRDKDILGLNVTIPYKEAIIPKLDLLNSKALQIGAVNTIKVLNSGLLKGYNTDYYGFEMALKPYLQKHHTKALILGTGGASKAVAYALDHARISYKYVSRSPKENQIIYSEITPQILNNYHLIINCTPLGTSPRVNVCPDIPYQFLNEKHLLFDLIYNPSETLFLSKGKQFGATTVNGLKMLEFQAEKAWEIWSR